MSEMEHALDALASAHGIKDLIDAHQKARRAVRQARRTTNADDGLAAAYRVAMRIWDADKVHGMPLAERVAHLSKTLRAVWPQVREWKYLCDRCEDYGFAISNCGGDATCGRTKPHLAHEYATPCWCEKGRRFVEKPKGNHDDFIAAGKQQTRGGFTKAGR